MHRPDKLIDCAGIVAMGAVLAGLLRPFQNTPFIDDWTYAWSVERLLHHGQLRILEWSMHVNLAQVFWGWLFCLPAGFSFTALRLSTFVLALSGLCGFYLLLREVAVGRRDALLGTAALGLNPIFFMLSSTFMTDVPLVAFMMWSAWAMSRALYRQSDRWLWLASGFAGLAVATRAPGAVVPVAMGIALVGHSGGWGRQRGRWLAAVWPLVLLAYLMWWRRSHLFASADLTWLIDAPATRLYRLRYALPALPRMLVYDVVFLASVLGLACLPLTLASVEKSLVRRAAVIFLVLLVVLAVGLQLRVPLPRPLEKGSTWALSEIGDTETMVPGYQPAQLPWWWDWPATVGVYASAALAVALLPRRLSVRGEAFLRWLGIGQFLLVALLWLFYDRYVLPLLPVVVALLLAGKPLRWPGVALAGIVVFGIVAVVGVHDHLQYNRALWQAVDELRQRGAEVAEIDGGYVVNGWQQYAHPDHAPRDEQGQLFIPGFTTLKKQLRYQISNSAMPGTRVLETIPYHRYLGHSGNLYILERVPG